jgi:DNA-binding MarR family transcriptional regulator
MKLTNDEMRDMGVLILFEMANTWSLTRVLVEHERATTSPAEQPYNEREILTLRLVEQFEGLVTATTLCKVFGLHHSQVGKIVESLVNREVLKKSGEPVPKKSGRGTRLELGPRGKEELKNIKLCIGRRFTYLYQEMTGEQLKELYEIIKKMHAAAKRKVEERVFAKPPDTDFIKVGS